MLPPDLNQTSAIVAHAVINSEFKELFNATLSDVSAAIGIDVSKAQQIFNAENEQEAQQAVDEALDSLNDILGEDSFFAGLWGAFTAGNKNQGLERKGNRRL